MLKRYKPAHANPGPNHRKTVSSAQSPAKKAKGVSFL
ncbi:hypothetical protein CJA_0625 [Cellvibrio japonicus Ueda107]|uniref:Uncharacterized protein n=1 Tax=Cellvibrio japonicus (strain Ueda107) TaxID=498211 RepID=B3PJL9_CELJU|nr:hypothetical protein CJA_0625 [Cellvibrio japonicus Ueda107]